MLNNNYFNYYPINSKVHQMNYTVKVIILLMTIISLFFISNLALVILFIITLAYLILTNVPLSNYFKIIYIFRFLYLILILFCAFMQISLFDCLSLLIKIVLLIESIMILTYTTSPIEIASGIDNIINPFNIFFIKTGKFVLIIMMSIKFIPISLTVTDEIINSQASRGFDYYYKTIIGKLYVIAVSFLNIINKSLTQIRQVKYNLDIKLFNYDKVRTVTNYKKVRITDLLIIFIILINLILSIMGIR